MTRTTKTLTTTTTTVKPTKLTKQSRQSLTQLAHRLVNEGRDAALDALSKEADATNALIAKKIGAVLVKLFPARDMDKLAEYGLTHTALGSCNQTRVRIGQTAAGDPVTVRIDARPFSELEPLVSLRLPGNGADSIDLHYAAPVERANDLGVIVHRDDNDHDDYEFSGPAFNLPDLAARYASTDTRARAIREEFLTRVRAYEALIAQSLTLEQVIDVWPEVTPFAQHLRGENPPSILPADAVEIVKRDVAERASLKALPAPKKHAA